MNKPQRSGRLTTFRLDRDVKEGLDRVKEMGQTKSSFINAALRRYLKDYNPVLAGPLPEFPPSRKRRT